MPIRGSLLNIINAFLKWNFYKYGAMLYIENISFCVSSQYSYYQENIYIADYQSSYILL